MHVPVKGVGKRGSMQVSIIFFVFSYACRYIRYRGVTIHKSHDLVRSSVFKSRFGMVFGTAGLKLYFYFYLFLFIY